MLSACSEYFEQMFALTVGKHPVIVLKDISKEVLETLLQYMYIGEVEVKKELLSTVIDSAYTLQIKGLVDTSSFISPDLGYSNLQNNLKGNKQNLVNTVSKRTRDKDDSPESSKKLRKVDSPTNKQNSTINKPCTSTNINNESKISKAEPLDYQLVRNH